MAKIDAVSSVARARYAAWVNKRTSSFGALSADKSEALIEIMVMAACVDGQLAPGEASLLRAMILETPGFGGIDQRGLSLIVESIAERVAIDGLEGRVRAVANVLNSDPVLCQEAYLLAAAFVHFDGHVGTEEQDFLDALQATFELTDEAVAEIVALAEELHSN
ncbi:MAG: tellurite resistance TerB family protein [Deltaproteobacteria bacterium]|nr:tellurite resistance TerB family protein [Deltaproteobacteria bacterium]